MMKNKKQKNDNLTRIAKFIAIGTTGIFPLFCQDGFIHSVYCASIWYWIEVTNE
jgi:hypothetical protein